MVVNGEWRHEAKIFILFSLCPDHTPELWFVIKRRDMIYTVGSPTRWLASLCVIGLKEHLCLDPCSSIGRRLSWFRIVPYEERPLGASLSEVYNNRRHDLEVDPGRLHLSV